MKLFYFVPIIAAAAVFGVEPETPESAIRAIQQATNITSEIQAVINGSTVESFQTDAEKVVGGLQSLVSIGDDFTDRIAVTKTLDANSTQILDALQILVIAHRKLMPQIIEKHDLAAQHDYTDRFCTELTALGATTNSSALGLIRVTLSREQVTRFLWRWEFDAVQPAIDAYC